MNKLGFKFTSKKQQALSHGDTTGTIIHPFFIPASQALGMHLCDDMTDSPSMARLQARYLQNSFELLVGVFKGGDWELRAQVALWIVAASISLSGTGTFVFPYLRKSCEAIDAAGLRFVPTYGRPPNFSEDLHEALSVLSQAIYFENFLFLTCGGTEPTMTARIEKEFRYQLPVWPAFP